MKLIKTRYWTILFPLESNSIEIYSMTYKNAVFLILLSTLTNETAYECWVDCLIRDVVYWMLKVNLHCGENVKPEACLNVSVSHWLIQTELWTYNRIIIISIVCGLKNDQFYYKLCSWNAQQPIVDCTSKIFAFQQTLFKAMMEFG